MPHERRPSVVLSPIDGFDTLHEKELAIERFEPYMETLVVGQSLSEVVKKTAEIENAISPDYPYSGISNFLVQYYGVELLPLVLPKIQRQHYAISRSAGSELKVKAIKPQETWCESIHGRPVIDLCQTIGNTILSNGRQTTDRIERVNGCCGDISNACFDTLSQVYPENTALAKARIYEHLTNVPRRRATEDDCIDYLCTLGSSHSLFGIAYVDDMHRPAILCIDPTIAQVDQTQDYDIEVTSVPQADYDNFLKLRYRTN